jgi:hypothetical protein
MNILCPSRVLSTLPWTALLALAACNVSATQGNTGGYTGDSGADCDQGVAVVLTDYMSTQIALVSDQSHVGSPSFLSSASSKTDGLAFALSGDVVLPRTKPRSGDVVLIDQSSNVLTWADPKTSKVIAQLPVGTGFMSDPEDYLEFDATTAYVTRYGDNAAPGAQSFDAGSDVLVVSLSDPQKPAITKSIPMPKQAGLPPRPVSMLPVGDTVIVVLQPLSDDYTMIGDGALVGLQNEAVAWTMPLAGLQNCDHPTLSPSGKTMAIGCEGQLDANGKVTDASASALALFDVTSLPPKLVKSYPIADQLGSTVQTGVAWVSETLVLGKTQTPLMGKTDNQAFTLDLTTGKAAVLLTAKPGPMGGKGLVYGDVFCDPGCGNVCMMADADVGVLRVWPIGSSGTLGTMSSVTVNSTTGLPPVMIEGY